MSINQKLIKKFVDQDKMIKLINRLLNGERINPIKLLEVLQYIRDNGSPVTYKEVNKVAILDEDNHYVVGHNEFHREYFAIQYLGLMIVELTKEIYELRYYIIKNNKLTSVKIYSNGEIIWS